MAEPVPLKFYGRSKRNAVVPIDTRRPDWLRVRLPGGPNYSELKEIMRGLNLHTVCEEARCPNIGECWEARTGTFMILGDTCTRACGFCAVKTGRPTVLDLGEPVRVAEAVERMGLKHAGITSVNRDELEDCGAGVFAGTIRQIRRRLPECDVEILTVGQYLRPSLRHLPIVRYWKPDEFAGLKLKALRLGFRHVEAGPLVRSSYHAANQVPDRAAAG